MVTIPKIYVKEGLKPTKAAMEQVEKLNKAVRKEVVKAEELVSKPASELFEKKSYMESIEFWHNPQSFANYARGQYLTEGGKEFADACKVGNKVIERSGNIERGFNIYYGLPNGNVVYYEKNIATGETRAIELMNGAPYKSYTCYADGTVSQAKTYHDYKTGIPLRTEQYGEIPRTTIFGADGETPVQIIDELPNNVKKVTELYPDGKTKKFEKFYEDQKFAKMKSYDSEGKFQKEIQVDKNTYSPKYVTTHGDGTVYFNKDGTVRA